MLRNNKFGGLTLPHFKTYCNCSNQNSGTGIKTDIYTDGIEQTPEITPGMYGHMIFDKDAKTNQ